MGHKWLPLLVPGGHFCPSMNAAWKYTAGKKEAKWANELHLQNNSDEDNRQ